jgi:hypothetical protein
MDNHHEITPFWQRLGPITRYPLKSAALMTLLALTFCRLVLYLPFGWIFNLFVWFAVYKYAVAVLRRTADGHEDPPEVSWDDEMAGRWQIALLVIFMFIAFALFLLFGPVGGTICAIVLGLAMPAATMSLAMDGDFGRALSPLTWVAMVTRIGWPYLSVALLCAVIGFSEANATALVAYLPPVINVLVFYFLAQYAILVAYHLMGYLVYQFHEALGFEAQALVMRRSGAADPDQELLDQAEQLVLDGQAQQAEALLGTRLHRLGGSAAMHGQYRKLLKLRGDAAALSQHGRDYINVLLAQGQDKKALELARECIEQDSTFTLARPEQVGPMARRAAELGQAQIAVKLLADFHKRHPRDPDVPANALLAARLLADKFGRDKDAHILLNETRERFADHALRPEMEAYLAFLDKLDPSLARG